MIGNDKYQIQNYDSLWLERKVHREVNPRDFKYFGAILFLKQDSMLIIIILCIILLYVENFSQEI